VGGLLLAKDIARHRPSLEAVLDAMTDRIASLTA
jgi:hypothetical protein